MSLKNSSTPTDASDPSSSILRSTLSEAISQTKAYLHPFTSTATPYANSLSRSDRDGTQTEPNRLLSDVAPHLMTSRMISAVANSNTALGLPPGASPGQRRARLFLTPGFSITNPARSLVRFGGSLVQSGIGRGASGLTSHDLYVLEESDRILATAAQDLDLDRFGTPDAASNGRQAIEASKRGAIDSNVSLLRGFQATIPTAFEGRQRRRKVRAIASGYDEVAPGQSPRRMGLKAMGDKARGLMVEENESPSSSFSSREQRKARRVQASREGKGKGNGHHYPGLDIEELEKQISEIGREREDISVRRSLIDSEISAVEAKIKTLEKVKSGLKERLMGLSEEELELRDELEGVTELLAVQRHRRSMPGGPGSAANSSAMTANAGGHGSSRRRKGPLFLPSEHDELPSGVAFMTLTNHGAAITGVDFSEPYGTLVSSSLDETVRVWDLASGDEVGRLRGHKGVVKCLQVEDEICITGSADGTLRVWDLTRVEDFETRLSLSASGELKSRSHQIGDLEDESNGDTIRSSGLAEDDPVERDEHDPCLRSLEGHSKAVTSLYFDDNCLVTGASDKTLRQWDLNTGQCVLTMDILWAISNPTTSQALSQSEFGFGYTSSSKRASNGSTILGSGLPDLSGAAPFGLTGQNNFSGAFSHPTPPFSDGSWEMYQDFVGGVQFWGYALASGSGDGGVRMWDMRTGQAHRTLLGHTAPVTCLQFDETYVISGSLDKSIRIWDLRTGQISDTIKYDFPVTALQFDTRKILAATGENGINIFNRTTLQHSYLTLNGHTSPAERLRYMDRYAISGGKDSMIKIWAL
ncbi:WD40 repeat-like protein [Violaceomyces palustris]|uniref:WD40 repeat-like protein n=1 Tax=Violaceomyces palustris TaxID=1673888 RepID=A0ACD0NYS6_9BASI|nr:WD40 repeat-like protein [Violaceomyces palustris]